ncbi:MAG: carbon starvation protein A [Chloroflexi bacterium]|nr:carbon starvation protein A [Chloroflexota bacterium]
MDIRLVVLLLILIPLIVTGAIAASGMAMNTLLIVVLGGVMIYLTYNFYSRRIDREIIQADPKKATPAKLYMDGVDFMPTSRNVLYGYHFKSIAAAGPITGPIVAATFWGWLPSLLWLVLGVTFIGWAADYSAIMLSVRNDGNSLSAITYRLIAPRTRTILFVFIFFYLLLVAGAFMGVMTALMAARPDVPLGLFTLAVMGLLAGQMLYRWKMDLIMVTVITVTLTIAAMALGPLVTGKDAAGKDVQPVVQAVTGLNAAIDGLTNKQPLFVVVDPTRADPRTPAIGADGKRPETVAYDAKNDAIRTLPNYLFWAIFLLAFSYLGTNLPIWRFAQPVNYIGFWIMLFTIGLSAVGGLLAPFLAPKVATFTLPAFKPNVNLPNVYDLGFTFVAGKQWQPLWPMLFVTIACGAISGWHSLIGSVNTSRQLEYETDALPVGGGGMLSENTLGLLALTAVAITGLAGVGAFATGVGRLLDVIFGGGSGAFVAYGTALGFGAFMVIVLTVVQLIFRVMRVTLTEWLGEAVPLLKNPHVSTIISMAIALFLLLTGTWVYLWQLFGSANQLMAALGLLIVSIWLRSTGRNPMYALVPMLFMYITTMAATIVIGYNQYVNVLTAPAFAGQMIVQIGGWTQLIISALLFVCAAVIAWDAWIAWQRYSKAPKAAGAQAE